MKILLTAVGGSGDILPFIAIAEKLKELGHTVKVCSYNVYKSRFDKINIPFAAVGPDMTPEKVGEVRDTLKKLSPFRQLNYLVNDVFLRDGEKFYADCIEASKGYHFGICHSLDFIGQHVMIHNKIPWASVLICPGVIPTRFYAPMHYFNWGKVLNKLSWKFLNLLKSRAEKKIESSLLTLNGIHRRINTIGTFSPHLNLIASSAYVGKTYPDLPKNFTVTGPWWLPEGDFEPPAHVETFIKNGKADVVFSFGSMGMVEGETRKELFLEAIEKAGIRAIIQKGWEGGHHNDLPENVIVVDYSLPFHYLFRQGKIVVHLGSSGTTIAACKAGAASIAVPHLVNQRYWAAMLHDLGVSTKPISPDSLSADRLAEKIKETLANEAIHQKASALKTLLATENGTDVAVKTIEEYVYNIK